MTYEGVFGKVKDEWDLTAPTAQDEAATAALRFGYPVALKVISPDLPHKTDVGAVALSIVSEDALCDAYNSLLDHARQHVDPERIEGVLVQRMVERAVAEALVGQQRAVL